MKRLRVLHVTPYFAGAWAYGGIPRLADALASGLAQLGHSVTVCTTDAADADSRWLGAPRRFRAWPSGVREDGVIVRTFPNVSNRLAYRAQLFLPLGLGRFLRRHRHQFDVAHLHACRNLPGILAGRHLRAAGIPYVLAPNGTAPIIERRHTAKHIVDRLAGNALLHGAARVIAVTQAEANQLRSLGVREDAICVVPNPIDLRELPDAPPVAEHGERTPPVIAWLGKLTPRKRVDVLIRAFAGLRATDARFAQAQLVIAGNDMGAGRQVRAVVDECGLSACTTFPGLLRGEARFQLLSRADVVAYAGEDEIFGLVPLEAIMCGTPVVVANDSGCGEVVSQLGGGLLVPPGDAQALGTAISRALSPRDAGLNMPAAARLVRERFGREQVCAQLAGVYREVVSGARAQASLTVGVADHPARPAIAGLQVPALTASATAERHRGRMLAVIPAHNEAANLPRVVADLRAHHPAVDVLVVDDGSCDGTRQVVEALGVSWLTWDERRGIGAAIRAGLRYAARYGYDVVVRVDADGQHGADDIEEIVRPILDARAEVVLGSRYVERRPTPTGFIAFIQWVLDGCLSTITRRRVTDATSGFCALGPQAIRMLAEHHPTGYPEPELRLFLSRNAMRVLEVPVQSRQRLSGRTSLTPVRVAAAAARVLLAMVIVPIRPTVQPPGD
jgi:glycosyltransferase involved in cell wall biosynthesis